MKRFFDLCLVLVCLLPALVVIGGLVLWIRLGSRGPGLLRQARVGRDEVTFTCFKLRTMYFGTPQKPSHEIGRSAVTPLGRVLRRVKLDELPQLINILRGDMSFVGPRPCLPTQTALIAARRRLGVTALRPGITGVAQVAGVDMSEPERLAALDATYLADMSLGHDLRLIARTLLGSGRGDRVAD
ncbi:sugar transferase [Tianweitania sediminis]|uniref:Sugar transferase n=1 Tax=Tianweitania sediminis TaxID=1502156 RepID=A0A8J7UKS4_9HYPH|nr:sugar transferase [Tianweitania sediminis]MBP0438637.1 sugar transferase [Tianweitania sediminis]